MNFEKVDQLKDELIDRILKYENKQINNKAMKRNKKFFYVIAFIFLLKIIS